MKMKKNLKEERRVLEDWTWRESKMRWKLKEIVGEEKREERR